MIEGEVDAESLAAAATVGRAATALAARARAERAGVLTLSQVSVLGWLARVGELTPGEVAARLRMLPQSLTRTFRSLEHNGWVTRVRDPSDGRQSLLMITESGREILAAEVRPRYEWVANSMVQTLTVTERKLLLLAAELLERLAAVDASPIAREAPAEATSEAADR